MESRRKLVLVTAPDRHRVYAFLHPFPLGPITALSVTFIMLNFIAEKIVSQPRQWLAKGSE